MSDTDCLFSSLVGAKILGIFRDAPEWKGAPACVVYFETDRGVFSLFHEQNCCESVRLNDITGDPADLIGHVVRLAEQVEDERMYDDVGHREQGAGPVQQNGPSDDTSTWTFYRLRTDGGDLDLRWLGESNGYYSEAVSFGPDPDGLPAAVVPLRAMDGS